MLEDKEGGKEKSRKLKHFFLVERELLCLLKIMLKISIGIPVIDLHIPSLVVHKKFDFCKCRVDSIGE